MSIEYRYQCAICSTRLLRPTDDLCAVCAAEFGGHVQAAWLRALMQDEQERRARFAASRMVDVTTVETEMGFAEDIEDVLEFTAVSNKLATFRTGKSNRRGLRWRNVGLRDCTRR